jgi:pimeloyl-ACP methyl ester carboxylesterase
VVLVRPAIAETVVEIPSRGQSIRALVKKPIGPAAGSVVLIAGGHGNLDLGKDGRIGWGAGNQLVRTRASYAASGFVTIVPDIAPDLKEGTSGQSGYRWSTAHANDLGAVVAYARALASPVYLVGTSRAALSVAVTGVTETKPPRRPDALVVTAGMLVDVGGKQPSVEAKVPQLRRITQPVLLVHHTKDGCPYTPPSAPQRFKPLLTGAKVVDIRMLSGGDAGASSADPCQAQSHHGFLGQDAEVVSVVTGWLKGLPK